MVASDMRILGQSWGDVFDGVDTILWLLTPKEQLHNMISLNRWCLRPKRRIGKKEIWSKNGRI